MTNLQFIAIITNYIHVISYNLQGICLSIINKYYKGIEIVWQGIDSIILTRKSVKPDAKLYWLPYEGVLIR